LHKLCKNVMLLNVNIITKIAMAKYTNRHDIDDGIYVYMQSNSSLWYARFKLHNKWYSKATKKKHLNQAIVEAVKRQTEFKIMLDNNLPVHTSRKLKRHAFSAVAKMAVQRMQDTKAYASKANYQKYIDTLNKYHIPFFGEYTIREIDENLLNEFDTWREKIIKHVPAKDTVKKHNAAMQRVLDEAVMQKYITQTELPKLTNNGQSGIRRSAFSKEEYKEIVKAAKEWIKESPRKKTQHIRELLYYYIQIAAMTGIRPGTEMEYLTYEDVCRGESKGKPFVAITVRKGKTTNYTGTRRIVVKNEIIKLIYANPYWSIGSDGVIKISSEKLFNLKRPDVLSKNFTKLLKRLGLEKDAHGNRSLYSLRHSYITWELEKGTDLLAVAIQCGTSIGMIERHYNHLVPTMFAHQLSGG